MKMTKSVAALLTFGAVVLSGCATNQTGQSGPTGQTATPAAKAASAEVPALKVTTDCGACQVKPTIPAMISEGYNNAAARDGAKVSSSQEASLVVKEYTARNDVARFMVGAMAGKDEIKAVITYQGKTYAVEDYYRNAWLGIETLAGKIGELAYAEMKQAQK